LAVVKLIPGFNTLLFYVLFPLLIVLSLIIIYLWVPGKNPSRTIDSGSEKKRFKYASVLFILIWSISCISVYFLLPHYLGTFFVSTAVGIVWQDFFVSPAGYRFTELLEKGFDLLSTEKEVI